MKRCRYQAIFLLLACVLSNSPTLLAQTPTSPTTQPTTAPTTTTAIILTSSSTTEPSISEEQAKSLADALAKTKFFEIIQGKKSLTFESIRQPEFWIDTVKDLIVTLLTFIPRLIGTLIFLFIFWLIYRGLRRMIMGSMKPGEIDSSIRDLLGAIIKWLVMGFGIVIACNQLGIPIVAMLTGVSLIGLAVGFAAQETLANFIAGIVIFLDKPAKIGDWIEIGGDFGQVRRVTFRAMRILTLNGETVIIPNTQVLSTKFSNHSTHPINRVNIAIGIAYRSSIEKAREVLVGLTRDDARLVKEPAPEVVVKELGTSSVDLTLRFWIFDESIEQRIGYEYREKAKNALEAAGIELPFPHVQLFVEQTPAISMLAGRAAN